MLLLSQQRCMERADSIVSAPQRTALQTLLPGCGAWPCRVGRLPRSTLLLESAHDAQIDAAMLGIAQLYRSYMALNSKAVSLHLLIA